MKSSIIIAFVALLASCGKKAEPPPPPTPDCATVVENALKLSKDELKAAIPTLDDTLMAKVTAAALARCNEDKWSSESLRCLNAAKTGRDVAECQQKLTPEQRDKLQQAIAAAAPPPPDPGSGSGSDSGSGSAGSGSATKAGSGSATKAGSGSAAKAGSGSAAKAGSGSAGSGSAKK
jgi:hypothetical protein